MAKYNRGEDIQLILYIQDINNALATPDTIPHLEIFNPDGSANLASALMQTMAVGTYGYVHPTLITEDLGDYQIKYTVSDGGSTTIAWDSFELTH